MEKKIRWSKSKLSIYLFYVLTLTFGICACGTDKTNNSEYKQNTIGSYQPTLIFPSDIPRKESISNALTGIDCEADRISTIEFTFIVNGSPHGPHSFTCEDHQAYIKGIPTGTDIRVDVYAYDESHTAVLYGSETTDIHAGQVTEGGEIEMTPVDGHQARDNDGDGYNSKEDCDDTNVDINPNAPEIPDNNVDENCDGQAELSSFMLDDLGMEFVRIPAGEFDMGSPAEEPRSRNNEILHRVRITQDFYLQTTEVTQGQWRTVVNTTTNTELEPDPSHFYNCGDDCPVERVIWNEIQLFIRALDERYQGVYEFRLPTEAQWEYAARAGSDTAFSGGPITVTDCGIDPNLDPMGVYCGNSEVFYEGCEDLSEIGGPACAGPHPVAEKNPNAWGLYDMHGNVWEWCRDWYEERYSYETDPVIDPQGPADPVVADYRVIRGGSWASGSIYCRSASRNSTPPGGYYYVSQGIRLVCFPINN